MGAKILVVEDDRDVREGLTVRLRAAGFSAYAAVDGQQAITVAKKELPDLILLDLGLPAGDGFVVIRRLKSLAMLASIPIVVISGRDAAVNKPKALQAGAVAYLTKPVNNEQLLSVMGEHLGQVSEVAEVRRREVLLVEDDPDTRRALAIRLRAAGYDVAQAEDVPTAMTVVLHTRPDVIVLDLGLAGGNGFTFLERLRRNSTTEGIPVIVLSAWEPVAYKPRALLAGAYAFFQKPADNADLLAAIESALAGG